MEEVPLADGDAFRKTGRARGKEDVGQLIGAERTCGGSLIQIGGTIRPESGIVKAEHGNGWRE
jgi:hypothetical protein